MNELIPQLQQRFTAPLPGIAAQMEMMNSNRPINVPLDFTPKNPKEAAVLCLLFPKENGWHIGLMKRTTHPQDKHSGQVSFPGGKYEEDDPNYAFTALRETEEEFGIPRDDIHLIGKLTPLYIPFSNFLVHPFVGYCDPMPHIQPDKDEVAAILQPSLSHLLLPETVKVGNFRSPLGWEAKNVKYFDVDGEVVWGATSMILNEFLTLVRELSTQQQ